MGQRFFGAGARTAASLAAVLLASCGGGGGGGGGGGAGGGGGGGSSPPPSATISGYVVEGPVSGATVKLYRVDAAGATTLIGSTVTDAHGHYSISSSAPANSALLVEANGGTYTDEISGQQLMLSVPMRAAAVSSGAAATISVTPYSEVAVRILEHAATKDWSVSSIASANKKIADQMGTDDMLDFIPVDLQAPPVAGVRDHDVGESFFTSGFSAFAHRVDPDPATTLRSALDGMYQLMAVDQHDDKMLPAFIGGMVDFAEHSAAPDSAKREMTRLML